MQRQEDSNASIFDLNPEAECIEKCCLPCRTFRRRVGLLAVFAVSAHNYCPSLPAAALLVVIPSLTPTKGRHSISLLRKVVIPSLPGAGSPLHHPAAIRQLRQVL
jgi:hypothetical protein